LSGSNTYYNAGNVGIGTASPTVSLEVAGLARITGTGGFSIGEDAAQNRIRTISGSRFAFYNSSDVLTGLAIRSIGVGATFGTIATPTNGAIIEGNVGIGTSSPAQRLHVYASGTAIAQVEGSGSYGILRLKNSTHSSDVGADSTSLYLDSGGAYPIVFYANSSERMRIASDGVVSIGGNTVLHAGNYGSYALPLSGGTVTGQAFFTGGGTTANVVLDKNIASPANYYNGLQLEVRATSGTAGISLHRNGYSHVGIYHDAINSIKFNMSSGTVTMDYNTGTVLGSGNYNSYAPTLTGGGASGTWGISVTGSASSASFADFGAVFDTRGSVTGPQTGGRRVRFDFLANSTDGLNDGGGYHGVMTFQQWGDASGGGTRQLGFTDNDNLWIRGSGSGLTSYNPWKLLLNSSNYGSYALPLSGGTVTGRLNFFDGVARQYLYVRHIEGKNWDTYDTTASGLYLQYASNLPVYIGSGAHVALHAGNYSSYALPLSGGTLTGGRPIELNTGGGYIAIKADPGGWAMGTYYKGSGGTTLAGFGAYGGNDALTYAWIGPAYNSPWVTLNGSEVVSTSSLRSRKSQSDNNYTTAALWTESYNTTTTGIAFHISGIVGKFLEMRTNGTLYWANNVVLDSANYSSYALPLSGGVLTGAVRGTQLTVGGGTNTDATFAVNGNSHIAPASSFVYWGGTIGNVNSWVSREYASGGVHTLNTSRWILDRVGYGSQPLIDAQLGNITLGQYTTIESGARVNGGIRQGNNMARPLAEWSAGGDSSGMVIFYLPGGSGNYGMVHMVFDIYEYTSANVSTVIVGGHNWGGSWYNAGANVIGTTNKSVRLGFKNGQYCVVFGGAGSTWTYGTVVLRKIHNASFYNNVMDMGGSFTTTQTTTESFSSVTGDLRNLSSPVDITAGGAVYASNWFRSYNQTGWYNQTYGGGIWMQDSTWVRVYGTKDFYATAAIAAVGNITAYYSDERLKTKVGDIDNALAKVRKLSGFLYVENDLARKVGYKNAKQQVGVSAQRVQDVLPEAVSLAPFDIHTDTETGELSSKSGENYLTVDYSRLVPLLIEAVKELADMVEGRH
jgi:hypothetical protein